MLPEYSVFAYFGLFAPALASGVAFERCLAFIAREVVGFETASTYAMSRVRRQA